ncbi:cell envelope integrity protein CreD [Qipengyuania sp. 483]
MKDRSPSFKLLLAGLVGLVLMVPLMMVYGLVSDRQGQARVAQAAITAGSGGEQIVSGPVLVVPFLAMRQIDETIDGRTVSRNQLVRQQLFISPTTQELSTLLKPEHKKKAIYETVIYLAEMNGRARFEIPSDLKSFGTKREELLLDEAQIRIGTSDPRGLRAAADVRVGGERIDLMPGEGTRASGGAGFHGSLDWSSAEPLVVDYSYTIRGSRNLTLVPRGGQTEWNVTSPWQHPGFAGSFLPDESTISDEGFSAKWSIGNLALGQSMVATSDLPPPAEGEVIPLREVERGVPDNLQASKAASIALVLPADIYAQVDRSVKYGFLFIGFTFVAFLLFDVVGGAKVAAAEYLLTGAGLVLFFVLLLAFAEWVGFGTAYIIASGAIIGLLTAYSAAVLGGWKRAAFIAGLLTALYSLLFVLLSLEAASLIIGSVLMFAALAGVMYATRNVDWSGVVQREQTVEG